MLAELELAELHSKSVKQQQASHEMIPSAEDQLDCFHRLDGADDSGQNAEDSAFRARRHKPGRRRFRIEAAITRAIGHAEHGGLPLKPENRTVHVWLSQQNASIVDQITRRKIIGPADVPVKFLKNFEPL